MPYIALRRFDILPFGQFDISADADSIYGPAGHLIYARFARMRKESRDGRPLLPRRGISCALAHIEPDRAYRAVRHIERAAHPAIFSCPAGAYHARSAYRVRSTYRARQRISSPQGIRPSSLAPKGHISPCGDSIYCPSDNSIYRLTPIRYMALRAI